MNPDHIPQFGDVLPNGATVIKATKSHVLARTSTNNGSDQFAVWSYYREGERDWCREGEKVCTASGHYFRQDLKSATVYLETGGIHVSIRP